MPAGLRNVLIVFALAAAVHFVPGGGDTAQFVNNVLSVSILAAFVLIAVRLYREHRVALFSLGDTYRALMYGAVGVAILAMAARVRLFESDAGTLVWVVALGGASYALYRVWRHSREYGEYGY